MKKRLLFPDICKFVAIFLVTCSHCAQYISGLTWTNFFFGTHLDIAFNMPLFMIISGWFINTEKMRATKPLDFIWGKFKRLMIPAFAWYAILLLINRPSSSPLSFYWYLTALFICMCIIYVFTKIFKNDIICMVVSTLIVLLCPKTSWVNINFMFPYLWAGVIINKLYKTRYAGTAFYTCLIIGVVLCFFWKTDYSVYSSSFDILHYNACMVIVYLYRFLLGLTISCVIVFLIKKFESRLSSLAKYGQYSLAVYTGSFVLNEIVAWVLVTIDYHTNQMFLIDVLSISLCIVIFAIIVVLSNLCRRNKVMSFLFLGE